jgi:hypothetical protein
MSRSEFFSFVTLEDTCLYQKPASDKRNSIIVIRGLIIPSKGFDPEDWMTFLAHIDLGVFPCPGIPFISSLTFNRAALRSPSD